MAVGLVRKVMAELCVPVFVLCVGARKLLQSTELYDREFGINQIDEQMPQLSGVRFRQVGL